ncbi:hypothetical protein BAG01nite_16270 [Brevibacillus agri]|uniref:Uncharacterized protein n=1 Tax=Brevibacillus agri TaxID=51101 RepID=A0A3M8AXH1_9BACL|nr:hypothetical protein BA6348_22070 [Brevibacillus agri]RNB55315.1 hypothetical protein EB820_11295 [Brevibacillus agri]GED25525.1 hypothetical protein BAG01nite_16270 [Brevibacillus agri]
MGGKGVVRSEGQPTSSGRLTAEEQGGTRRRWTNELLPSLKESGETIKEQIRAGKYRPNPVRRVEIPKENSGSRLIRR